MPINEELEHAYGWFEEVLFQIYEEGNIERLEEALEEVAYSFGMKIPKHSPVLSNKNEGRE